MDQDFIDAEGAAARPEILGADPDPETRYLLREEAGMLFAALKTLRPALRRSIELRELAELLPRKPPGAWVFRSPPLKRGGSMGGGSYT